VKGWWQNAEGGAPKIRSPRKHFRLVNDQLHNPLNHTKGGGKTHQTLVENIRAHNRVFTRITVLEIKYKRLSHYSNRVLRQGFNFPRLLRNMPMRCPVQLPGEVDHCVDVFHLLLFGLP
jgi:hypothetical protein